VLEEYINEKMAGLCVCVRPCMLPALLQTRASPANPSLTEPTVLPPAVLAGCAVTDICTWSSIFSLSTIYKECLAIMEEHEEV